MKINIELDITPDEFKELFSPSESQLNVLKTLVETSLKNTNNPLYESLLNLTQDNINAFLNQNDIFSKTFFNNKGNTKKSTEST